MTTAPADALCLDKNAYEARVLACLWLPIAEAALCLACEAVFRKTEPLCPACASAITTPLLAFLAP